LASGSGDPVVVSESEDVDGNTRLLRSDGKSELRVPFGDSPVADPVEVGGKSETRVRRAKLKIGRQLLKDTVLVEFESVAGSLRVKAPRLVTVDVPDLGVDVKGPKRVVKGKRVRDPDTKVSKVKGKRVSFDGVLGVGSNIDFDVTGSGVKETITVAVRPDAGDRVEFRSNVSLEGLTARNTAAGVEFVGSDGKVRFTAPSGVAWDSSRADSLLASRSSVSVVWDGADLVVLPDAGWMADPRTVFPVFIDPTFTVEATRRASVEANNPNLPGVWLPQFVGNFGNRMRAFERFDTSSLPASIDSAEVVSRMQYCDGSYTQPVRVRKVTGGWGGPQGNPVLNASFESFPAGNPTGVSEWSARLPLYGSATRVASPIGTGEAALKIVASPSNWMAVESVPFPVVVGEQFYFQMDTRTQNATDWVVARAHFYTDVPASGWASMTDGTGGVPNAVAGYSDPVWTQPGSLVTVPVSGSFTVPAGMKYARISIHHNGAGAIVDNVVTMRNGNSLVANPGLQTVKGWTMRAGAGGFDDSSGSNLWMSSWGGWNAVASAPIAVRAGEELTISTDVLMQAGTMSVVRAEYYPGIPTSGWNTMTDVVGPAIFDLPWVTTTSPNWRNFSGKSTVPAGAKWARMSIHHIGSNTAIAIDNAQITRPNLDPNPANTTWNTQPPVSTTEVASGVSNYQLTDFPIVVTDMVRGWIANPATNYGIRLDMDNMDDTTGGPYARCSINGGYLRVIYDEGLAPLQPTAPNTLVNGGFESGTYQWNPCFLPQGVSATTEKDPAFAATGNRYLRVDGSIQSANACQWVAYDTNGFGDNRLTLTAKVRSKVPSNSVSVLFSQQGNENAGAHYYQSTTDVAAAPTASWQTVSLTMCEQSGQNNALGVHFGTTVGKPLFVDDVAITIARDSRPFIEGGCTPPPSPVLPCEQTGTCPPPADDPCGTICHPFDDGVLTDIKSAVDYRCIARNGISVYLTSDENLCLLVVPEFSGDGIYLRVDDDSTNCLGPDGTAIRIVTCSYDKRITDWENLPNAVSPQFPIRTIKDNAGYSACLDTTLTFGPCDNTLQELWYDPPKYQFGMLATLLQGGTNDTGQLAYLYTLTSDIRFNLSGRGFESAPYSHWYRRSVNYDVTGRSDKINTEIILDFYGVGTSGQIRRPDSNIFYGSKVKGDIQKDNRNSTYFFAPSAGFYTLDLTLLVTTNVPNYNGPAGGSGVKSLRWMAKSSFCLSAFAKATTKMRVVPNSSCNLPKNPTTAVFVAAT
jgi:hypothetical protein